MKKESPKPQTKSIPVRKGRTPKPENHWVILVKNQDPFYFQGNEQKADGVRMYHGVKHSAVAWKRMALPDEILMKKALRGIEKNENVWTPRTKRVNYIKKFFPEATDEQVQSARILAEKHIEKNTRISDTHTRKTLEIHARNQQPVRRKKN